MNDIDILDKCRGQKSLSLVDQHRIKCEVQRLRDRIEQLTELLKLVNKESKK